MKVDLTHIAPHQTNAALELLCKSVEDSLIWNDHPTDRIINAVERSAEKAISDPIHILHVAMQQVFRPVLRKAKGDEETGHCRELDQRIRSAPAGALTMTDYLDIIDCLMLRYMPADFLNNRVKRQSVKQYMAGYIRHDVKDRAAITAGKAASLVDELPETITDAKKRYSITPIDESRIRVAQASAARLISNVTAGTRSAMQKIIVDAEKNRINRQSPTYDVHSLQQSLSDNFASLKLRYMPADFLNNRVKRQSVKQYMAGYIRHDVKDRAAITAGKAASLVDELPETITDAKKRYSITPIDESRIRVAQASAARLISNVTAGTRSAMQKIIVDAEKNRINRQSPTYDVHSLQQSLSDNFASLNLDWRRIAVTETAINVADGFLSACAAGEVLRWAAHPGACHYCESQNGKLFTVVSASQPHKDPATQVWPGKHLMNVGRSIAKMKRTESGLEPRSEDEMLVPAIPAHPHCRCSWIAHVELTEDQKRRIGRA